MLEALGSRADAERRWRDTLAAYELGRVNNDVLSAAECGMGPSITNHSELTAEFDALLAQFDGIEAYAASHPTDFRELLDCLAARAANPPY